MPVQSLAVFCGSRFGNNPLYKEHTAALGRLMARYHISLVYGGGSVGLMGCIADEVMLGNGKVIGVIPQVLVDWERQHRGISQLIVVPDMHTRKKQMYELCDAAVILPGGFGTMDEFFEMLTWNQLSIHDKQLFILNSAGYYDHLVAHIHHMRQEGFLYEEVADRIQMLRTPEEIEPFLDKTHAQL
ncbi:MAG TPA: TIGR00730 family Rossman fold protein [Chitinophagaceae bacterium]|nr:TIGR00730 family Rossman fold protein [Chitinophagaceae bacterium]